MALAAEPLQELAFLASVLDGTEVGVLVRDRASVIRYANAEAARILGAPVEALVGEVSPLGSRLLGPGDRPLSLTELPHARVLRSGEAERDALIGLQRDGTHHVQWLRVHARPLQGDAGQVVCTFTDATAEVAARAQLAASEGRYQALLDLAPVSIFEVDDRGRVLHANRAAHTLLDALRSGADHDLRAAVHPDDLPRVAAAWTRAMATGAPFSDTFRLRAMTGVEQHVSTVAHPVTAADGRVTWLGAATDLTELLATREQLERLFAESMDLVVHATRDGLAMRGNPAFVRVLGTNPTTSAAFLDRTHPDDRALVRRWLRTLLSGEALVDVEHRVRDRHGRWRWLSWRVPPSPDGGRSFYGIARDVTERRLREQRLEAQAQRDPLTGLANRTVFLDALEAALVPSPRGSTPIAVAYVDLDGFKQVNDQHGHHAGDEVLRLVAERIQRQVRGTDLVARMGGDEFTVLFRGLSSADDSGRLAHQLAHALLDADAPTIGGHSRLTGSVGVAAGLPGALTADEILRRADRAMYQAKERGGGVWVWAGGR